jgi:hypothetical protein
MDFLGIPTQRPHDPTDLPFPGHQQTGKGMDRSLILTWGTENLIRVEPTVSIKQHAHYAAVGRMFSKENLETPC